jgi:alkanesulfonate monooxygenase SsuD/methylene tetrahydromethanopterin reductase-like flavin-dependent oxidoreductase (luciferase family)
LALKHGLNVPCAGNPLDIVELAVEAEKAGWDGFFVWDQMQGEPDQLLDIFDWSAIVSAIAVSTSRIAIGPMVVPLARRRPWKVAKELITVDHLSRGRVICGFGLGNPPKEEFADFGEPSEARTRAALLDEGLAIVDRMLTGASLEHAGAAYDVHARMRPAALQRPRPPIWVAAVGTSGGPLARARCWDGVFALSNDFQGLNPADVEAWRVSLDREDAYTVATSARAGVRSKDLEDAGLSWRICEPPVPRNDWIEDIRRLVLDGPDASDF